MANLFIVYTPFQLFVAQQIVNQEKLADNILIEGYIGNNSHFFDIYKIMEMDNYWKKRIKFPDISYWDGLRISSIHDARKAYKNYKKIKKILEENNVKLIFLGEHQNQAMRFTNILFSHLGYNISFFEEGAAHYIDRNFIANNSIKKKIKIFLMDFLYYLPVYHVKFAKWRCNVNMPCDELSIYKRYNILPRHNKPYDVDLKVERLIPQQLLDYMVNEVGNERSKVLLMTDPIAEIIGDKNMFLYFETIKSFFYDLPKDKVVYIKFHPRDPLKYRKKTIETFEQLGLEYRVLSKTVNIPVEYYLQSYSFEKIYLFNSSTYYYDGYVYPHCDFINMLPKLYNKCMKNNVTRASEFKYLAME